MLTELERGKILAFNEMGLAFRAIARRMGRSSKVIRNFLADPNRYMLKKRRGIRKKISHRDRRRLVYHASHQIISASKLQRSMELKISVRRVQQLLHDAPNLRYGRMRKVPWMTESHVKERIQWAKDHMMWTSEWKMVIFSDEKKFNLDGPDGLMCCWHDVRRKKYEYRRRSFGGGSVMVWGAIHAGGKSRLAVLEGKQNAESYIRTLGSFLLPMLPTDCPNSMIFQQDNAAVHTAHLTKMWLLYTNINIMDWPAHSPDLNPIENVWGLLARRVYADGRTFETTSQLKSTILTEWNNLGADVIQSLIQSMPGRCKSVLDNKGHCI